MSAQHEQDLDFDDEVKESHPNLERTFALQENRRNTSKCSTIVPTIEFQNVWDISSFSVQQEMSAPGEAVTSTTFGDDQHEFFLKLFPCGKDDECSAYISIFLQINRCPSNKIQFRVNFTLETLDGPRGCPLNRNIVTINRGGIVTASKFFGIDLLKNRANRYIPDDILRLTTDITVYGEANSFLVDSSDEYSNSCAVSGSRQSIAHLFGDQAKESSLEKLLKTQEHSDFELHIGERIFKLHKAILSARSPYFEGMLKPSNREYDESKAVIEDISPEIMEIIINYMYSLQLPEIDDSCQCVDVIYAADRFLLQSLKNGLMQAMSRNITYKNILTRLELAYRLQDDNIFKKAAKIFAKHRGTLLNTDEWKKLKEEYPGLAMEIVEKSWEQAELYNLSSHSTSKRRRTNE